MLIIVIVVIGAIALYLTYQIGQIAGQGIAGAGGATHALLQAKDRQASVTHNPSHPVMTSDQADLVWTYNATGLFAEINSFKVGPIHPDIITSNLLVSVQGWTATRSGQFVVFTGPRNVLEGSIATGSFQTSAEAVIAPGALQATIFVDIIPATRGARDVAVLTFVPAKPD